MKKLLLIIAILSFIGCQKNNLEPEKTLVILKGKAGVYGHEPFIYVGILKDDIVYRVYATPEIETAIQNRQGGIVKVSGYLGVWFGGQKIDVEQLLE